MFIPKFVLGLILGIVIGVVSIIAIALISDFVRRNNNGK